MNFELAQEFHPIILAHVTWKVEDSKLLCITTCLAHMGSGAPRSWSDVAQQLQ